MANSELTISEEEKVRQILADVYTFVRSQEINRTIANFTFDHYIVEAKEKINGTGSSIRDASGKVLGTRPSQLESLTKLEEAFNSSFETAKELAKAKDNL